MGNRGEVELKHQFAQTEDPLVNDLLRYDSIRIGKPTWQVVTAAITRVIHDFKRAQVAADRKWHEKPRPSQSDAQAFGAYITDHMKFMAPQSRTEEAIPTATQAPLRDKGGARRTPSAD